MKFTIFWFGNSPPPTAPSFALPPAAMSGISECWGPGSVEECVRGFWVLSHWDSRCVGNLEMQVVEQSAVARSQSEKDRWWLHSLWMGLTPLLMSSLLLHWWWRW